ncbi:hypothetical protein AM202_00135 [Actinobacillus minor 202]|uniref:ABC transporter permease n=1 Tax=Actinobacillus minor 202 TaxID=591023 RepID=A0ABP2GRL6_9PAST|nr:hypothetical protein AM202_00135 [Actinobacillus minor 202]
MKNLILKFLRQIKPFLNSSLFFILVMVLVAVINF